MLRHEIILSIITARRVTLDDGPRIVQSESMRTILCILLASTFALAAADFSGAWSGTLERDGAKAPLSLTLLPDEDGLTGTVLFNAAARRPIEKAALDGNQLTFESRDIEGWVTRFRLTVAGTKITGEANFGGQVWAVHLARSYPATSSDLFDPSASSNVFRVGGGVSAPVLITLVQPEYTEEARKNRLEGTVILYVEITPSGAATNIKVVRSLGMGLDEKAVECVKKWKFKPGRKGDQPVTVQATIEVNFKM
jgi:TonB family protein